MSTVDITGAAKLLQVHPQTVLNMIGDGVLPAAKIGRAYVLLEKDIMSHIEAMIVRQTAQRMRSPHRRGKVAGAKVAVAHQHPV